LRGDCIARMCGARASRHAHLRFWVSYVEILPRSIRVRLHPPCASRCTGRIGMYRQELMDGDEPLAEFAPKWFARRR